MPVTLYLPSPTSLGGSRDDTSQSTRLGAAALVSNLFNKSAAVNVLFPEYLLCRVGDGLIES